MGSVTRTLSSAKLVCFVLIVGLLYFMDVAVVQRPIIFLFFSA